MRLRALSVRDFRCIEAADVEFADGLNVLHGPNDLGKSTLVEAIRAALLLQHTSKQGSDYKPWGTDRVPRVELRLCDDEGRQWRVRKAFSTGRRGSATLEWSNDGAIWTLADKNRGVDGKLRELLAWGMPDAGAKGSRGAPSSFLATILVGPQMQPGAVFNTSLADDKAESGRERLGEALQALAEDPTFKEVLERAQDLVERAFTKDNRKRTAKDSPFRPLQERIKELTAKLRELDQQVISSENVRDQLGALQRELDAGMTQRDEANEALVAVETAWKIEVTRRQAQERLQAAQTELTTLQQEQRALEQLRDHQHELSLQQPAAEAAATKAEEQRVAADRAVDDAGRRVEEIEQGGDAEGKLHKQSLHTRRLELRASRDKVYERLQRAQTVVRGQTALEELQEQLARAKRDLATAATDAQAAERRQRLAEAERKSLDDLLALRRLQDAQARLDEAESAAARAKALRDEASTLSSRADGIEAEVAALSLPDADALADLRRRDQALRVAEARLGGGLSITARALPSEAAGVVVTADADDPRPLALDQPLQAGRKITIELSDGTVLEIVGGEADARAEAGALRAQWDEHARPVLERAGVDDVTGLERSRRAADLRLREADDNRKQAAAAEQRATTDDTIAADREARAATVVQRRDALGDLDRAKLAEDAGDLDEAALLDKRNRAEAAMEEGARTATLRAGQVAELKADSDALQRRVDEDDKTLRGLRAALGGDPDEVLAATRDEHAAVEGKLEQVEEEYENVERESAGRLQAAQEQLASATRTQSEARTLQSTAAQRLDGIKTAVAQVSGQLREKEALVASRDADGVHQRVHARTAELEALPAADPDLDEAAVEAARQAATDAAARVRELDKALASQRGELKQVGGNVVLEDRVETESALQAARADETELELDYEGYRLLVDVMRQTESAEGHHLGQALAGPVRDRFARLTEGRYGALSLDADLDAKGLEANGALRSIDALSAGLQEQLATLLRLAVAEQLDSALVLDDHLTQTDPARIDWFRSALLETSGKTQVVVMTCREDDYLRGEAPVHSIDLRSVIRRVPGTAELPAAH